MKKIGVNNIVISLIIIMFSLFGAVFGMSEETLAFVIILVPLAISMGYDSITRLCMVYVAAHVGFSGAILNPFTIGITQGLSDLPLFSGFEYRLFCWFVLTTILIVAILIYASRIKRNPKLSPMYEADKYWRDKQQDVTGKFDYNTPLISWIMYGLIFLALCIFCFYYPRTTFSFGATSFTIYAVPVLAGLYAITGYLALKKSFHFLY